MRSEERSLSNSEEETCLRDRGDSDDHDANDVGLNVSSHVVVLIFQRSLRIVENHLFLIAAPNNLANMGRHDVDDHP